MQDQLVQFVTIRGKTSGCVVAKKQNGKVFISGSLCNRKKDAFDRVDAIAKANHRIALMASPKERACPLPYSLHRAVDAMISRSLRYFKDTDIISPPIKTCNTKKDDKTPLQLHRTGGIVQANVRMAQSVE